MAGKKPLVLTNGKTRQIAIADSVDVTSGGTGVNTLPSGQYVKGAGTSPVTTVATIPNTDITGLGTMSTQSASSVAITGGTITGLSAPTNPSDAVTKAYADALKAGLDIKDSVRLASTANIDLTTGTLLTIDGVVTVAGNRVLVKNQTTASQNGIYVAGTGAWSRSTDANEDIEVTSGMYAFVSEGTVNASNGFVLTTADPIVVGTTSLTFTQFSGAGQVVAGAGLTKNANTLDVVGTAGRIVVNADDIDLATAGTAGTYDNVTTDAYGRVTSGAAITAGAGLVRTANDLAVVSTGSGSLTVTADSVNLTTGIATPGTYGEVTVDAFGRVTSGTASAAVTTVPANADTYTNNTVAALLKFAAVYSAGAAGAVQAAVGSAAASSEVLGFVTAALAISTAGTFVTSGTLEGTTGEWDAVTGQTGGLTAGSLYYLSAATAGRITATAPSTVGQVVAPVGIATSTTRLNVRIQNTIEL